MEVLRSTTAGFCMGVALALRRLDELVAGGGRVVTYGPVIHNPQVLAEYAAKGVECINSPEEAASDMRILIRAHGIPKDAESALRSICAQCADATCPRVKAARVLIEKATEGGAMLFLYGESEHPEVRGLVSYAQGSYYVSADIDALLERIAAHPGKIVLAAQTTQDSAQFAVLKSTALGMRGGELTVLDTICDATGRRQEDALRIARETDCMVVVGGRTSGNTRRLCEMVASLGVPVIQVETAAELSPEFFRGKKRVGLTAGASAPKRLVDDAEQWLLGL